MDELRRRIGQLLLIGFRGLEIDVRSSIAQDLKERNLGGIILFDEELADRSIPSRNVQSPAQVRELVRSLKSFASTPPFVAIDQEGGRVNRLKAALGFPPTVSQAELGALNNVEKTFAAADSMASTLSGLGINLNLAPVVDIDTNPDNPIIAAKRRSFSREPAIVTRHSIEFCRAHRERGVFTCAKHFPGHGSARGDTHLGMVDVTDTWNESELIPFQELIRKGSCDMVMTAHVIHRKLDPDWPATMSHRVVTGLLRGKLGFDGVVMSDDLQMKAISENYSFATVIEKTINAGIDLLCFGNNSFFDANIAQTAIETIASLVGEGRIGKSRIDESFDRILRRKGDWQAVCAKQSTS